MQRKGFFLYEIGLLLLLPFVLTTPVFESNSEEKLSEESRISSSIFGQLFNESKQSMFPTPPLWRLYPPFQTAMESGRDREARQLPCSPTLCPQTPSCKHWTNNRYRSPNGICNNLKNPLQGSAGIPFIRYLPSDYDDGISIPRGDQLNNLPTSRQVSVALTSAGNPGPTQPLSLLIMQWGQFIDHDMVFTPEFEDEHCCEAGIAGQSKHPECRELNVVDDKFYSQFDVECLRFLRSESADPSCVPGKAREQMNALTSYIDGSQVYGSSQQEQDGLRTFVSGQLKIGPGEESFTGSCPSICPFTFLPRRLNDDGDEELFAGDRRVQEQPGLTSMHTLFVRAHNDFAMQLQQKCPSADDDKLFFETRRIVSALIQQITYGEFLPVVLGTASMDQYNLYPLIDGYSDYDPSISASAPNVFATAAFRFGHSLIKDIFPLDKIKVFLHESFGNLGITMAQGRYPSDFLRGMSAAEADGMDHFLVESITNLLFAEGPSFKNGSDLLARNILRGRDHGLPPYNAWRELCKLEPAFSFDNLVKYMPEEVVKAFASAYKSVEDIDLFPAGIAEFSDQDSLDGGILGPTFTCIIGKYFRDLKFGDRYYYETDGQPDPFTPTQLKVIRQTTLSSLICAYTNTQELRRFSMLLNVPGNPELSCKDILQDTVPYLIQKVF